MQNSHKDWCFNFLESSESDVQMFMFLTIVCQPEYSGTFEVMSVAEYHQPFIQKS